MEIGSQGPSEETACNLALVLESARDLVSEIRHLSRSLDARLKKSAEIDEVISILREKKVKVDTLRDVVREIKIQLRVGPDGAVAVPISEAVKLQFAELMRDFHRLLDEESRIESLVCGQGFPISRGVR